MLVPSQSVLGAMISPPLTKPSSSSAHRFWFSGSNIKPRYSFCRKLKLYCKAISSGVLWVMAISRMVSVTVSVWEVALPSSSVVITSTSLLSVRVLKLTAFISHRISRSCCTWPSSREATCAPPSTPVTLAENTARTSSQLKKSIPSLEVISCRSWALASSISCMCAKYSRLRVPSVLHWCRFLWSRSRRIGQNRSRRPNQSSK